MNVRAFSEDIDLMDRFLEKPPKWLKELGIKDKQKEYLEEKVLLEILERFEFKKHDYFEGVKIEFEKPQV